jgi:hypothetical protein
MPAKQADQVNWASNFSLVISNPSSGNLGLSPAQITEFSRIAADLSASWNTNLNPATRTKVTVAEKRTLLRSMKAFARNLVGIIQSTPTVTDAQKQELRITIRKTTPSKPVPPTQKPEIKKRTVDGRNVTIEILNADNRRGRPAKTFAVSIWGYFGENPEAPGANWVPLTTTGKNIITLPFGPSATGDKVWLTAFYLNGAKEAGPASDPMPFILPAGGTLPGGLGEEIPTTGENARIAA